MGIKNILVLAAGALVHADIEFNSVVCDGSKMYVRLTSSVSLGSFSVGTNSCSGTDIEFLNENTQTSDSDTGTTMGDPFDQVYTHDSTKPTYNSFKFDPYACNGVGVDNTDMSTYSVTSNIKVYQTDVVGGETLNFGEYTMEAKCEFEATYDVETTLGVIGVDSTAISTTGKEYKQEFDMKAVANDDHNTDLNNPSYKANDQITLKIFSKKKIHAAFTIAPTLVQVVADMSGTPTNFDLFNKDTMTGQCGYATELGFSMLHEGKNGADSNWIVKYNMFVMENKQSATMKVKATIAMCAASNSSSDCKNVSDRCDTS